MHILGIDMYTPAYILDITVMNFCLLPEIHMNDQNLY